MCLSFTRDDLEQAKRLNARLDRLPRFRMQTKAGRVALNVLLWLAELYPLLRRHKDQPRPERRSVSIRKGRTRLRVFRPSATSAGVILHFHGGGWTIGNSRMSDRRNARLAARLGVTVIAVDYHLAVFRALDDLIEECAAVAGRILDCARTEFGTDRVLLWGSSAGAHLAASVLLRLRTRHAGFDHIRGAVLLYGLYDMAGTSMVRAAGPSTLLLHGPTVRATLEKLTPGMSDAERRNGGLSPLFADLAGLPPALFLVGERDMLLEDNQRMARAWNEENGNGTLVVAPESPHAFDHFNTAISRKIEDFTDHWIRERLSQTRSATAGGASSRHCSSVTRVGS